MEEHKKEMKENRKIIEFKPKPSRKFKSFKKSYDPRFAKNVIKEKSIRLYLPQDIGDPDEPIPGFKEFYETYESENGFTSQFIINSLNHLMVKAMYLFRDQNNTPYDWEPLSIISGYYYYEDKPGHIYPNTDS